MVFVSVVFVVAIMVSVYWEHVANTAEKVADAAEETTETIRLGFRFFPLMYRVWATS